MCNQVVNSVVENFELSHHPRYVWLGVFNFGGSSAHEPTMSLSPPEKSSRPKSLSHQKTLTRNPFLLKNLNLSKSMATFSSSSITGKLISTSTMSSASKRLRTASPPSPVFSSISVKLLTAFLKGMGLAISPPLPIICNPFRFLKSLNLNSVGLD